MNVPSFLHSLISALRLPASLAGIIGSVLASLQGCAGGNGPEYLTIRSDQYTQAFDAALEVARASGMPAVLRDRRTGIIETDPEISGSVIEPWRTDNEDFAQTMENTIAFQRRRARFEFAPAEFKQPASQPSATELAGVGPDVIGVTQQSPDLSANPMDLELRVWVFVERAETPGIRRSTWTRRETTPSKIIAPTGDPPAPDGTFWVPIKRDEAYERRLLAQIEQALAQNQ